MFDAAGLPDPRQAHTLACALTSAGIVIASLEWLVPSRKLDPAGLLSAGCFGRTRAERLWRPHGLRAAVLLRLACAASFLLLLLVPGPPEAAGFAALGAGLLSLPLRFRDPVGVLPGTNGAEHVLSANLLALGAAGALGTPLAIQAALAFVAARAMIEYASAGITKLQHVRHWASGAYLQKVFASGDYGNPHLATLLTARPALAGFLSLVVIAIEVAAPLALVSPAPFAELLLLAAFAFHVGTAVIMGLNTFMWAFAATYAPILYWRDVIVSIGV